MRASVAISCCALVLSAPASAQLVGSNPPGIESPGCAGDCTFESRELLDTERYSDMIDRATANLIQRGYRSLKGGKTDRAVRNFRLALERQPDHAEVRYHAGIAYFLSGKATSARPLLESAIYGAEHGQLTAEQRAAAAHVIAKLDEA